MLRTRTLWIYLLAVPALAIGAYPLLYIFADMSRGLLGTKSEVLLKSHWYLTVFRIHIFAGAIALLTGWSQFSTYLRSRYLRWHRRIGKIYIIAVLASGFAGLFIAFFATGGPVAGTGFTVMAVLWLIFTLKAFNLIRRLRITAHRDWMIRSYAVCYSAVTLRFWLPLLGAFGLEFSTAYPIVAWLSFIPNVFIAEWIIRFLHVPRILKVSQQ